MAMAVLAGCKKSDSNEPVTPEPTPDPTPDPLELKVSTEPSNRYVVIEEYTGIGCGYCPEGHKIVADLMVKYPGKVFGVNIHAGYYAQNTYTTTEGDAYASEASIKGYPAGCVDRHLFTSYSQQGGIAMGRGYFETATKNALKYASPVNIGATALLDTATRQLTVKVKGYFTSEQTVESNSLYVFLLQDSVMGTQNGSSYNPDQVVGSKYRHMHMFRTCITGTWGEEITPLTVGTYFDREYNYTIPAQLGSPKAIDAVLKDLKVLVFIAEGHKEIFTACEPTMVIK